MSTSARGSGAPPPLPPGGAAGGAGGAGAASGIAGAAAPGPPPVYDAPVDFAVYDDVSDVGAMDPYGATAGPPKRSSDRPVVAPRSSDSEGDGRALHVLWTRAHQALQQRVVSTDAEQARTLHDFLILQDLFGAVVIRAASAVVEDLHLPPERRRVPPLAGAPDAAAGAAAGSSVPRRPLGIAGGEKYAHDGVFFKLATDNYGIHGGSDAAAAKVAGCELRALSALLGTGVRRLYTPLMTLITYRGWRVSAVSALPISDDTLVYGSADGGTRVAAEATPETSRHPGVTAKTLWRDVAAKLNLCSHPVLNSAARAGEAIKLLETRREALVASGDKAALADVEGALARAREWERVAAAEQPATTMVSWGPGDAEIHAEADGSFFVVDVARLMPPTTPVRPSAARPPPAAPGAAAAGAGTEGDADAVPPLRNAFLFHHLRPEFVKAHGHALSSDAFSRWGLKEAERHNALVRDATEELETRVVRELARRCDSDPSLCCNTGFHQAGVNMRYLSVVRSWCDSDEARDRLAAEMVARSAKCVLLARWRAIRPQESDAPSDGGPMATPAAGASADGPGCDEAAFHGAAIDVLNAAVGTPIAAGSDAALAAWRRTIVPTMRRKYEPWQHRERPGRGCSGDMLDTRPSGALRARVTALFMTLCGVSLTQEAKERTETVVGAELDGGTDAADAAWKDQGVQGHMLFVPGDIGHLFPVVKGLNLGPPEVQSRSWLDAQLVAREEAAHRAWNRCSLPTCPDDAQSAAVAAAVAGVASETHLAAAAARLDEYADALFAADRVSDASTALSQALLARFTLHVMRCSRNAPDDAARADIDSFKADLMWPTMVRLAELRDSSATSYPAWRILTEATARMAGDEHALTARLRLLCVGALVGRMLVAGGSGELREQERVLGVGAGFEDEGDPEEITLTTDMVAAANAHLSRLRVEGLPPVAVDGAEASAAPALPHTGSFLDETFHSLFFETASRLECLPSIDCYLAAAVLYHSSVAMVAPANIDRLARTLMRLGRCFAGAGEFESSATAFDMAVDETVRAYEAGLSEGEPAAVLMALAARMHWHCGKRELATERWTEAVRAMREYYGPAEEAELTAWAEACFAEFQTEEQPPDTSGWDNAKAGKMHVDTCAVLMHAFHLVDESLARIMEISAGFDPSAGGEGDGADAAAAADAGALSLESGDALPLSEAVSAVFSALDNATSVEAYAAAEAFALRALEQTPLTLVAPQADTGRSQGTRRMEDFDDPAADEDGDMAVLALPTYSSPPEVNCGYMEVVRLLVAIGRARQDRGDAEAAVGPLLRAQRLCELRDDDKGVAAYALAAATACYHLQEWALSLELLRKAVPAAERAGSSPDVVRSVRSRMTTLAFLDASGEVPAARGVVTMRGRTFTAHQLLASTAYASIVLPPGAVGESADGSAADADSSPFAGHLADARELRDSLADDEVGVGIIVTCEPIALAAHLYSKAMSLASMGRAEEAIVLTVEAESLNPRDPAIPYNLAMMHAELGDFAASLEANRRTLALCAGWYDVTSFDVLLERLVDGTCPAQAFDVIRVVDAGSRDPSEAAEHAEAMMNLMALYPSVCDELPIVHKLYVRALLEAGVDDETYIAALTRALEVARSVERDTNALGHLLMTLHTKTHDIEAALEVLRIGPKAGLAMYATAAVAAWNHHTGRAERAASPAAASVPAPAAGPTTGPSPQ